MKREIEAAWAAYRRLVLPKDAGVIQVEECRRAFYAGAYTVFTAFHEIGEPEIPEDEGIVRMTEMGVELREWQDEVTGGGGRFAS